MALFKSAENKSNEQERKIQAMLDKYGLGELSDPMDVYSAKRIAEELVGTGLMETGMKIGLTKPEIQLPILYQRAIMEQNFIIIRQLNRISKALEK